VLFATDVAARGLGSLKKFLKYFRFGSLHASYYCSLGSLFIFSLSLILSLFYFCNALYCLWNDSQFQYAFHPFFRRSDFPKVDWVVQYDCPEDADEYIHRAGRTARQNRRGYSLLFLLPNEEEPMLKRMAAKKIPIKKTQYATPSNHSYYFPFEKPRPLI
jgi:hypothetical protein